MKPNKISKVHQNTEPREHTLNMISKGAERLE